jgi:hypothetical protein
MKKYIFIYLAICHLSFAICYSQTWQWAKHFGSNGGGDAGTLCIDSSGNSYLTGTMWQPYGIFGNDTVHVVGPVVDAYITKVDNNGNFIWAKRAGGSESFAPSVYDNGSDILYDKSDNSIIFCGTFESQIPSKASIGTCLLTSGVQTFLSKIDTSGNCIWAKVVANIRGGYNIVLDNSGNIYMIGSFASGTSICSSSVPKGGFIAKFKSSDGSCMWSKNITEYNSGGTSISYYNNKLYIIGQSSNDTLKIDTATSYCYPNDIFISEFDTAGNVKWVKTMGGRNNDYSNAISLDGNGNIYITGEFKDTTYFGSTMLTNGNNDDWFLAKYDNTGNFIWAKQAHVTGSIITGATVSSDANGNIYAAGGFSGTATFGTFTVTATTATDLFVVRYDSNGNCIGIEQAGNSVYGSAKIISDNTGGFHIAGVFKDTTSFGSYQISSYNGSDDVFVARHDAITGIEEGGRTANNQLLIYANPNAGKCNITIPDELLKEKNLTLRVYDVTGRLIQQVPVEIQQEKIKVDLQEEAKGIYQVTLSGKKKTYSGKIIFE